MSLGLCDKSPNPEFKLEFSERLSQSPQMSIHIEIFGWSNLLIFFQNQSLCFDILILSLH